MWCLIQCQQITIIQHSFVSQKVQLRQMSYTMSTNYNYISLSHNNTTKKIITSYRAKNPMRWSNRSKNSNQQIIHINIVPKWKQILTWEPVICIAQTGDLDANHYLTVLSSHFKMGSQNFLIKKHTNHKQNLTKTSN